MLNKIINKVLVLSLPFDVRRRQHIIDHFSALGIVEYEFMDAICHRSSLVKDMYLSGRVKGYPSCFRCERDTDCTCENNALIPQQVANWLSFKKVWKQVASAEGPVLVCEDDVFFYPGAMRLLSQALRQIDTSTEKPLLIRLANSGLDSEVCLKEVTNTTLSNKVVMSNVAFIMNAAMASLLLNNFTKIETTSDIFIHSQMAHKSEVIAYTIEPLLATDLSYNKSYAKFISRIHPKGLNEEDTVRMNSHIKRVNSEDQYQSVLEKWLNS